MKILITGVAGFIGSNTAEFLLQNGNEVVGFDNFDDFYPRHIKEQNLEQAKSSPVFSFFEGDLRDNAFLDHIFANHQFDVVLHLAAKAGVRPSVEFPKLYEEVNVTGTKNLLEAMHKSGHNKLVFASSSSVYGDSMQVPFRESDELLPPESPYAGTMLRLFSVYGPRQRPDMGIARFFHQIVNDIPLTIYGDGSTRRDYTFVGDIVRGIDAACRNPQKKAIINLGNSEPIRLSTLIEEIEAISKKTATKHFMERQDGDVFQTYAEISLAKERLSYNPGTSLTEGLTKQFEYTYPK